MFSMAMTLGGEIRDQFDLFLGKRTNFLAIKGERLDQFVLLHQWNSRAYVFPQVRQPQQWGSVSLNVISGRRKIGDVNGLFLLYHTTEEFWIRRW